MVVWDTEAFVERRVDDRTAKRFAAISCKSLTERGLEEHRNHIMGYSLVKDMNRCSGA
jgi:hypothetical protein